MCGESVTYDRKSIGSLSLSSSSAGAGNIDIRGCGVRCKCERQFSEMCSDGLPWASASVQCLWVRTPACMRAVSIAGDAEICEDDVRRFATGNLAGWALRWWR